MGIIFYDKILIFDDIEKTIKKASSSKEEEFELWDLFDDFFNHKTLGFLLNKLPKEDHLDFLEKFERAPFDERLIDYLKKKIGENVEELMRQEIGNMAYELLGNVQKTKLKKKS